VAQAEPLIRNISDTALLAAVYRARETQRQDALFRDPFASCFALCFQQLPTSFSRKPFPFTFIRKTPEGVGYPESEQWAKVSDDSY
jgi:hypothetical protein